MSESVGAPFVLTHPPVTRVRATVFFERLSGLAVSRLSGLIEEFRTLFPSVTEQFPVPAVNDETGHGVLLSFEEVLPFPLVTMAENEGGREIAFQDDRFSVIWHFEGGEKNYPGFRVLRTQLEDAFSIFSEHLKSEGYDLRFERSQCLYHNEITEMPASGLSLYMLTGREELTARELFAERTYSGVRVRYPVASNGVELRVSAGVDSSSEDESDLWIKVTASGSESTGGDPFHLLDLAHDKLIEQFIAYTPDWLRQTWGD